MNPAELMSFYRRKWSRLAAHVTRHMELVLEEKRKPSKKTLLSYKLYHSTPDVGVNYFFSSQYRAGYSPAF